MPIDDVAARGFGAGAAAYESARPGYPDPAIALLADAVGIGRETEVCDLAAGTGKLTRRLLELGARVTAVEPIDAMRARRPRSRHLVPRTSTAPRSRSRSRTDRWTSSPSPRRSTGSTPRPRSPRSPACSVPDGRLAILWNERDESTAWVAEMSRIIHWHERTVSRYQHTAWAEVVGASGLFTPLLEEAFPWDQPLTREMLADRVRSISYIAAMPTVERERHASEVVALVARRAEPFPMPYVCRVQWCQRS